MNSTFISVPFKIDNDFSSIAGMGKFSSAGIILEYETKLFGIIKNGIKESRISLEDILDVKFKKGMFKVGAKIEIRLKNLSQLNETPNKDGKISLKIERNDFELAQTAVEKINKDLTEKVNNPKVESSPVSRLFEENDDDTKELNEKR